MKYDPEIFRQLQERRLNRQRYSKLPVLSPVKNEEGAVYLRRIMGVMLEQGYCYIPTDQRFRVRALIRRRHYKWAFKRAGDGECLKVTIKKV